MIVLEIVFWIIFAGFFAGVETGMYALNQLRLKLYSSQPEKNTGRVKRLTSFIQDKQGFICMTLLGTNICNHFRLP